MKGSGALSEAVQAQLAYTFKALDELPRRLEDDFVVPLADHCEAPVGGTFPRFPAKARFSPPSAPPSSQVVCRFVWATPSLRFPQVHGSTDSGLHKEGSP
ncbi:hypothetical protein PRIPAC_79217 [Pristionchus pacificus]|uniref:Uncharacterized protein n=1 Tax=Pristionchus pacificus TaxID=54126 RepID=A0A2A6CLR0_PRIPA|nr:hypothetical protein PRIPAC_79217 [Pristionchus pacificus]|eukprot:PDM79132.1 hypothetical protein PRIPAC_31711 [Pristionchus pacificus]